MRADEALSNLEISGVASVNIEVDKDAELSIVIDKANGDFKIKREAQLTVDSSGKTGLTGRYS
jgi:hypothetical protein